MTGPRWIKQWINELAMLNERFRDEDGKVDFTALGREEYKFRMALITQDFSKSSRARDTYSVASAAYKARVENGMKGGRPRNNPDGDASNREAEEDRKSSTSPSNVKLPRTKQEVIEFAIDNGLDPDDASTWAEQNLKERHGMDKDGNQIMNWKGALTNYCKAMKKKRSA